MSSTNLEGLGIDMQMVQKLMSLGIDPTFLGFFPKSFTHPKLLDINYNPPDSGRALQDNAIVTLIIATIVLIVRVISRTIIFKKFEWDDVLIVPAWLFMIATTGVVIHGVHAAKLGKHLYDIGIREITEFFPVQYVLGISSPATVFFTRASILAFLLRISPITEHHARRAFIALHVLNIVHFPAQFLPMVFQCAPREYRLWDINKLASGRCFVPKVQRAVADSGIAMAAIGVALDVAMLLIPIKLVWGTQMTRRKKFVVTSVFGIGFLACIASLIKAYFLGKQFSARDTYDLTWTYAPTFIAGQWEICFGMITACAPGVKALHRRVRPKLQSAYGSVRNLLSISADKEKRSLSSGSGGSTRGGDGSSGSAGKIWVTSDAHVYDNTYESNEGQSPYQYSLQPLSSPGGKVSAGPETTVNASAPQDYHARV